MLLPFVFWLVLTTLPFFGPHPYRILYPWAVDIQAKWFLMTRRNSAVHVKACNRAIEFLRVSHVCSIFDTVVRSVSRRTDWCTYDITMADSQEILPPLRVNCLHPYVTKKDHCWDCHCCCNNTIKTADNFNLTWQQLEPKINPPHQSFLCLIIRSSCNAIPGSYNCGRTEIALVEGSSITDSVAPILWFHGEEIWLTIIVGFHTRSDATNAWFYWN